MTEPTKIKGKLLDAVYINKERTVAFWLECESGRFQTRISRNQIATFGDRTEEEIELEMDKYVDMLKSVYLNKDVNIVFDTDLNKKLKDNYPLKY